MLVQQGWSEARSQELIDTLARDYRDADLSTSDRAMLDYVRTVSLEPARIRGSDIETLRAAGFDDRAIHDICAIAAYFAFVNRIADGLGVELEPRFTGAAIEPPAD